MRKKTKEYQTFVLKDIFPEYKLKEYMNGMKNILQKNGESEEVGDEFTRCETPRQIVSLFIDLGISTPFPVDQ